MLKSRSMWPPTGWVFRQPETGWQLKRANGFNDAVKAIIAHRQSNPRFNLPTDETMVADELDNYICSLLKYDPHWCVDTKTSNFSKPLLAQRPLGEARASVAGVKFLRNASAGIKTWIEWFGAGKLVEQSEAERRGSICAACPQNQEGDLLQRFGAAAGMEIMEIFAALKDLNTHTIVDDRLHICNVCSCPLKAKVWCPLELARKHMSLPMLNALPEICWLRPADQ